MQTIIKLNRIKTVEESELQSHLTNGWKVIEAGDSGKEALGGGNLDLPAIDSMTVPEWQTFAEEKGIDLDGATRKDEIYNVIKEAIGGN